MASYDACAMDYHFRLKSVTGPYRISTSTISRVLLSTAVFMATAIVKLQDQDISSIEKNKYQRPRGKRATNG